jgi:hypothetical protein
LTFTKGNEFQRLFELKKNEDQNNIKNGDYDPERYYCLHSKTTDTTVSRANQLKGKASPENLQKGGTTKLSDLKGQYV